MKPTHPLILLILTISVACTSIPKTFQAASSPDGFDYYSVKDKVFLSGQPMKKDLEHLIQDKGVSVVISLRAPQEMAGYPGFKVDAEKLGLTFYQLPLSRTENLDPFTVDQIEKTFMKHHKSEKVLVHCGSGQRAAAWFATHIARQHGKDSQTSLAQARKLGLNSEVWRERARRYIDKNFSKPQSHKTY